MAFRSLAVLTLAPEDAGWESRETWTERLLIGLGLAGAVAARPGLRNWFNRCWPAAGHVPVSWKVTLSTDFTSTRLWSVNHGTR